MTDPRLSTVFDYSSLRLHPDGTRVYQKSSNFRPGLVKVTTQDPRSNWIARDAGGLGSVPKVRKRVKDASEGDVRAEQDGDSKANPELSDDVEEYEGAGRKRKRKRVNIGKLKRHKFINDDSYLEPDASSSKHNEIDVSPEVSISEDGLPEPSADLLKCIHRFASEFYTERGQLLNISREYRKERKERALRRRARREKQAREDSGSPSGSPSSSESSNSDESSSQKSTKKTTATEDEERSTSEDSNEGDDDNDKANQEDMKGKRKVKSKRRRRRRRRHYADKLYTDMYKMFDGSAMMVLGMLVQEQIAEMLNPQMPDAWKQEMEAVYGPLLAEENPQRTRSNEDYEDEQSEQGFLVEGRHMTLSPAENENVASRASGFANEDGPTHEAGSAHEAGAEEVQDIANPPDPSGTQHRLEPVVLEPFNRGGNNQASPNDQAAFRQSTGGLNTRSDDIVEMDLDDLIQSSSEESLRSEDTEDSDSESELD